MDLTPPPGAHDADVGLSGYVPGWSARGHTGYSGYAWYRLRVRVTAPERESLSLAGPPAVDDAYQVFVNGQLLGNAGEFSANHPTVYSIQPRVFVIPNTLLSKQPENSTLIAFRVWMGPWDLGDPAAGGIHIAPALGLANSIDMLGESQWLQTFKGYIVEVVEAAAFVLLAVMALTLSAFERSKTAYYWLAVALMLTALFRANQAVFFWGQIETAQSFEAISVVLLIPLCLAAWTLAWHKYFSPPIRWMPVVIGLLAFLYIATQFLSASWFYGAMPRWILSASEFVAKWVRISFLGLTVFIAYQGLRRRLRDYWLALFALTLISIGQFSTELSALGIPGIWFPYGTGVSRTQFAYAAFDFVLFGLLLWRSLWLAGKNRGAQEPTLQEGAKTLPA